MNRKVGIPICFCYSGLVRTYQLWVLASSIYESLCGPSAGYSWRPE